MKGADRVTVDAPRVLYLVISGAPAPEGLPSLVTLIQKSGWRLVVLTWMAEVLRVEVEELTGPGGGDGEEGQRVYEPAAEIERAREPPSSGYPHRSLAPIPVRLPAWLR
jgi:hypothetical protein